MKTNDNGIKKCLEETGVDWRLIREFNCYRAISGQWWYDELPNPNTDIDYGHFSSEKELENE